ncbi:MAG TPA: hypothetical protein VGE36_08305 [Roseateles sp.]
MLGLVSPVGLLIGAGIKKVVEGISESDSSTPITKLKEESVRAEIKAKALMSQAKVEQELAISRRIDSAEEVEIEEFYDTSGKGTAGLSTDGEAMSVGLGGEGRRVTRRVIKFKGCAPMVSQMVSQPVASQEP